MKKHILLFSIVSITLLFSACSTKPREVIIENRFKMDIPSDMMSTTILNDDASLQYLNVFKELYVMVIDESPQDIHATIQELELEDEYPLNFDGFCNLVCSGEEKDVFAAEVDRDKLVRTTINGMNARTFSNTRDIDGMEVYYQMAMVEGQDTYYQIVSWTLPKNSKKYKTLMEDMIKSFDEVNQ